MTNAEEPAESTTEENAAPRGKGGKRRFTITEASRNYERALAKLTKVCKGDDKVEKAQARLERAQAAYDDAVSGTTDNTTEKADAQREVDETKAVLDALVRGTEDPS